MTNLIEWLKQALSENGFPSSQRLFAFIAIIVISIIALMLTLALMDKSSEPNLSNTLINAIYALAALGGTTYVGARMAGRNHKPKADNVQPVEPTKPV